MLRRTSSISPLAASRALIEIGQRCDRRGWVPATSGNFSVRLDEESVLVTASGCHKGELTPDDFLVVDLNGQPKTTRLRPSAETLLHCERYRRNPATNCVLHTHSVAATVLSRRHASELRLVDYELFKAFSGVGTHAANLRLPVLENDQDMNRLAAAALACDDEAGTLRAYLIAGHGLYTWAEHWDQAFWQLEALEHMLSSELHH